MIWKSKAGDLEQALKWFQGGKNFLEETTRLRDFSKSHGWKLYLDLFMIMIGCQSIETSHKTYQSEERVMEWKTQIENGC